MNKVLKTILITSIAVFGVGVLFISSTQAQVLNLVVEFEQTPLFSEVNFLPGDGVTRWVKVTNNTDETQKIAVEAINQTDPNGLGDVLNLEIKENGTTLFDDTFSAFFAAGEMFLSDLAGSGTQTQYDFIADFTSADDAHQTKSLGFDILIGFQGAEGNGGGNGGAGVAGAGGGAGGALPPGLTIQEETVRVTELGETSVTIEWLTSYSSTSQVIYAAEGESHTLDLSDTSGTPPKYGYAHTTPEFDVSPKVTFHSVIITGLIPGTTYFYRVVSHASLAVTLEHSFTTLSITKEEAPVEQEPIGEEPAGQEQPIGEGGLVKGEETPGEEPEEVGGEEGVEEEVGAEEEAKTGVRAFMAAIGDTFGSGVNFGIANIWWILLLAAAILSIAVVLLGRRKKQRV